MSNNIPWNKGKKNVYSKEALLKMSNAKIGAFGEAAPRWKGMDAGYTAKHMWIHKHYGKATKCENPSCNYENPKRFDWANVSRKYLRDKSDYKQLCVSCHKKADISNAKNKS